MSSRPVVGLLLVLPLAVSSARGGATSASAPDEMFARWHVPAQLNFTQPREISPQWAHRLMGYLPTEQGVELRYSVLLPPGKGPFPVIINYSGYDPGAIGGYAYLHDDTTMSISLDQTLLDHGYAVMGVNAPGTGCSQGQFDMLGPSYGQGGASAVEWAAKQSWSDGSVGMANWSWAGMSQVATAEDRPAHLKAIAPGMVATDPWRDLWHIGGIPSYGPVTLWWQFVYSRWLAVRRSALEAHDLPCVAQVDRNYAASRKPAGNLPTLLIRHPLRDGWYQERTLLDRASSIAVPVLSMEAFQDEETSVRGGYYQQRLDPSRLWLVETNGNHDLYESLRFRSVLVGFLDRFVKGVRNSFERTPHVQIWMETRSDAGQSPRHEEDAVPGWVIDRPAFPAKIDTLTLTLRSGNRLDLNGQTGGAPDSYQYPTPGPSVDTDVDHYSWGPLSSAWREGSVWYTSPPLSRSVVIDGPVSANLWVSTTQSDTDLQVTLTDVRPDGEEEYVQRGWLRLSDRALDEQLSTAHLPWHCDLPECLQAVTPGVPVLARVELTKVAQAFRAGDRIRIWVDTPSATGGIRLDHSSLSATGEVWHDRRHESQIVFGVLPGVSVPSARPACGVSLMQPCRADPLTH